jgi:hypothetical protein
MSQAVADSVRHLPTIVVSDSHELRPDAIALVSNDTTWWRCNPMAKHFAGRKFSTNHIPGVELVKRSGLLGRESNSGVVSLYVALEIFGFTKTLLLGFDCHGTHYFGPHKEPLRNTTPQRFEVFKRQFHGLGKLFKGRAEIINCTPNSALECFPKMTLAEAIA